jgi:predicted phage terminase large subunit-like protein
LTLSDFDLIESIIYAQAQDDFLTFRRVINPKAKIGWFFLDITAQLKQFYNDLVAGLRPKLIIQAPPQHGKSEAVTDFICWISGKNPDLRSLYASFSERLGVRANLKVQRTLSNPRYKRIFPATQLNSKNVATIQGQSLRNKEILEYVGHSGYFRNTTVQGAITGEGLDIGFIDDPIKGREAANSATMRQKAWDWFTDDFFTRFSEDAGLLMILTRWHVDDPAGRMIDTFGDKIKVLKYEAIAVKDEEYRNEGDPLFPELKSLDFLLERKNTMPRGNYEALYQQSPIIQDGEIMRLEWFRWWDTLPVIVESSIFVDTAQKKGEANDFTVAQLWGNDGVGNIFLMDMIRVKENAPEAQKSVEMFYFKHALNIEMRFRKMWIEDKSSGSTMIQNFKNRNMLVDGIQRNVDKVQRANIFSGYIEMGKVYLNSKIPFISNLTDETVSFPNGIHDDTLDPMMDAIEKYCMNNSIDVWNKII